MWELWITLVINGGQVLLLHWPRHSVIFEQTPSHHPQPIKRGACIHLEQVSRCVHPGPLGDTVTIYTHTSTQRRLTTDTYVHFRTGQKTLHSKQISTEDGGKNGRENENRGKSKDIKQKSTYKADKEKKSHPDLYRYVSHIDIQISNCKYLNLSHCALILACRLNKLLSNPVKSVSVHNNKYAKGTDKESMTLVYYEVLRELRMLRSQQEKRQKQRNGTLFPTTKSKDSSDCTAAMRDTLSGSSTRE